MNRHTAVAEATPLPADTLPDLIARSGFYASLSPAEARLLAEWVRAYSFPAGSFILKEGEGENCLCVLVEGAVNIYKETEPDKHLKIASIRPGESIGEMGVVDGQPFSASVIATQDTILLVLSREDFDTLLDRHETLGNKLLRKVAVTISLRLRATTGRLADLLANK